MKMKKVLAAALAGTMVFAMTVPVFAANPTRVTPPYDCWWWDVDTDGDGTSDYNLTDDEVAAKIVDTGTIKGDGTWTIAVKCIGTDLGDDQMYTITGDIFDNDETEQHWVSFGTHGDIWGACTPSGQNTSVDPELKADNIVTFTIARTGSEFSVTVCKDGTPFLKLKASDAQVSGDTLNTRIVAQYGVFDVYQPIEGDAQAAIDAVKASSGSSDPTASDDDKTADKTTGSTDGTSNAAAGDTGSAGGTSSGSSTTTTPKTGDATPIVAILVAVAGCGAVAFASKKRFAK